MVRQAVDTETLTRQGVSSVCSVVCGAWDCVCVGVSGVWVVQSVVWSAAVTVSENKKDRPGLRSGVT